MKFKFKEVLSIINGQPHNLLDSDLEVCLDWLHVIETGSIKRPIDSINVCYFAVCEINPEIDGWYNQGFDNRTKVMDLFLKNPEWFFVVESDQFNLGELIHLGCKLVVVKNTRSVAKNIFDHVLAMVRPTVVGVTGSVGKTTCVALLEDVLNCYGKTLRIYSKRLSPLSIITSVINQLDDEYRFIVTEYSLYRQSHVEDLARLLKPAVGAIINIESSHLGVNGLDSKEIIFECKSKLLDASSIRIISSDLNRFDYRKSIHTFGIDDDSRVSFNSALKEFIVGDLRYEIELSILTKLSVKQALVTLSVLDVLGLAIGRDTISSIEKFRPKEDRLSVFNINKTKIIFDGEMSNASRLVALGENYYDESVLVITQQNHGDEPLDPQRDGFSKIRNLFKKVYVVDSIERRWLNCFGEFIMPDSLIAERDLLKIIDSNSVVFIHAGGYFRFGQKVSLPFTL